MSIVTNYQYDNLGRKTSESILRTTYPTTAIAPLTASTATTAQTLTTHYQYDALDRVTLTVTPDGIAHQTVYDANGQIAQQNTGYPIIANQTNTSRGANCASPVTLTNVSGSFVLCTEATNQYDAADRKIKVTDILGNGTQYAYDNNSNVIQVTDANGHAAQYQYDSMNRQTAVINANGQTTATTYDLDGHATAVKDANGNITTRQYDPLGRLTQAAVQLSSTTSFITSYQYDANGNKICMIDANANSGATATGYQPVNANTNCTVKYVYDQLNRLTQTIDAINTTTSAANNRTTSYTYNLYGEKLSVTDANNATTSYLYDDLGRMTQTTDPLTNIEAYVTDETGNVIKKTDRKGQVFLYAFDSMNRKIQTLNETDNTLKTRTYDPSYGDLLESQNSHIAYTFAYDNKHRKISKTDSRLNKTLNWTYDPVSNIKTKTDYQGDVTTYQYDNSNKLVAETNPAYLEVSYHYDNGGRLLDRILSNGARTHYEWDDANRLTQLQNTTVSGHVVNNTGYIRDAMGNILTATEASGTSQTPGATTYTYDADYRLLSAGYPTSSLNESFSYDAVGNRKTYTKGGTTYYYNRIPGSNRLKNITTGSTSGTVYESYVYDNNGNLTSISGNRTMALSWTANNKVSQIQVGSITPYTYQYDPKGYRIQKTVGTVNKNYYLEKGKLEAIYDGSGDLQAKYLRGSVIDEVVNGYQFDSNNNFTNYSFHHDNLESVLGQSSHDGNVLASQGYTSFGTIINASGSSSNNILKFTGREQDTETGLIYYRARYYDPLLGMMLSEDPMRFGAGVNFYIYAGNNPINYNDPFGFDQTCYCSAITFSAVGPNQATGIGALGISPPNDSVAISPAVFGLPYSTIAQRVATQKDLINNMDDVTISAPGLSEYMDGGTTFTIGDVGDQNIRNATSPQFDIYRFATQQDALSFGKQTVPATITGVPDNWSCPSTCTTTPPAATPTVTTPTIKPQSSNDDEENLAATEEESNASQEEASAAADGGFVLYPNMSNTNQLQSVYRK